MVVVGGVEMEFMNKLCTVHRPKGDLCIWTILIYYNSALVENNFNFSTNAEVILYQRWTVPRAAQ